MATNGRADDTKSMTPWYVEEHVRSLLVNWLRDHGYFQANGATAADADHDLIVQSLYGATSRISVRGFPESDGEGEAQRWFASAVLDLARHRSSGGDVGLALALPAGFPIYTTLAADIAWLRDAMPFTIYWVVESGTVHAE